MNDKITFVFCDRKNKFNLFNFLIKKIDNVEYSHVAIILDDIVYESVFPKSRNVDFNEWIKTYDLMSVYSFVLSADKHENIINELNSLMNKKYSFFQVFVIGLRLIFRFLNNRFVNIKWNGNKFLICTELVGYVANKYFDTNIKEQMDNISLKELNDSIRNRLMEKA